MEERIQETLHEKTFTFRGEVFTRSIYNDVAVLIDQNKYYRATGICKDNGKDFYDWLRLSKTKKLLDSYSRNLGIPISIAEPGIPGSGKCLMYKRDIGGNETDITHEVQGWYTHPILVQHVADWADTDYAINVAVIMDLHNERNKLLQEENAKLKAESEAKDKKIEDLEASYAT